MILNPYELDGSQFLVFYSLALFLVFLFTWPWRARASGQPPVAPERLRLEHWAVLAGGPARAAQATFVRALQDGSLVWNESELRYEPINPNSRDPLAQMLRDRMKVPQVMAGLERSCASFEKDLQNWGLLLTAEHLSQQHFKISLGYGFTLLLGIVRVFQGLMRDRPVGFLIVLMGLAIVLWVASIKKCRRQTREGLALLNEFSVQKDHIRRAPPESEMALAVALGGVAVLNGSAYGHFMWAVQPERKNLESTGDGGYLVTDSGGSSDSGGSGDSGDGGGSGCGGCGGGD